MTADVRKHDLAQEHGDPEQRRETGTTLVLIGWMFWLFAALVLFFAVAQSRMGSSTMMNVATLLAATGLVLYFLGLRVRRRSK